MLYNHLRKRGGTGCGNPAVQVRFSRLRGTVQYSDFTIFMQPRKRREPFWPRSPPALPSASAHRIVLLEREGVHFEVCGAGGFGCLRQVAFFG